MPVVLSDMPNCPACHIDSVWVVIKRKPLAEVPFLYRWLARWVYFRIGWSSDYSIELIGVYTDKSEAYHAACGNGYAFMEVPLHASLPNETCQYGLHEFPHSEANIQYRGRRLDYVPIERQQLAMLGRKIEEVETCAAGQCQQ